MEGRGGEERGRGGKGNGMRKDCAVAVGGWTPLHSTVKSVKTQNSGTTYGPNYWSKAEAKDLDG